MKLKHLLFYVLAFSWLLAAVIYPAVAVETPEDALGELRQQLEEPEVALEVLEVEEGVKVTTEEDTKPRQLEEGEELQPGARIEAIDGEVSLNIPGITHMELAMGSQMEVNELESYRTEDAVTENEIDLEMYQGEINSRHRGDEEMETEIEINTPNSVAGVRGTVFQCDIDESTSCSVLSGSLEFASRAAPERSQIIEARQRSSMRPGEEAPDEPEEIDEESERRLSEYRDRAQFPPAVDELQLEGEKMEQTGEGVFRISKEYREEELLTLSGTAEAREDEAELEEVEVQVGDEQLSVEGLEEWSAELEAEPPEVGEEKRVNGRVRAHDSLGNSSRAYPFQVELDHPEPEGVIPPGLDEGDVPVEITEIGGISYDEISFPFQLSGDQFEEEEIVISGRAKADEAVEGVAYRQAGEENWTAAEGTEDWNFNLPADEDADFELEIVAWTSTEIGGPVSVGPIEYIVEPSFPPFDFREGDVEVEVEMLAGRSYDDLDFPYHTYQGDLEGGQLLLEGVAEAPPDIAGVAYRYDGGDWQSAGEDENWRIELPADGEVTYDRLELVAWSEAGEIGDIYEPDEIVHENITFNTLLRRQMEEMFDEIENENRRQVTEYWYDDFYYRDSRSGREKDYYDFRSFLRGFFRDARDLSVFYDVDQLISSHTGGEVNYSIEWRGVDNNANRPFVMVASDVENSYVRAEDGQFKLQSMQDFPLHMYVFNREDILIDDLGSISIEDFRTYNDTAAGDIIAETFDPAMIVNKLAIGGEVEDGGIKRLTASDFSDVSSISSGLNRYDDEVGIEVGEMFGVNIVKEWGEQLTALIEIVDVSPSYVQVRVISARDLVDGLDRPVFRYRGVDPF